MLKYTILQSMELNRLKNVIFAQLTQNSNVLLERLITVKFWKKNFKLDLILK